LHLEVFAYRQNTALFYYLITIGIMWIPVYELLLIVR
jgi:hypothetical protein